VTTIRAEGPPSAAWLSASHERPRQRHALGLPARQRCRHLACDACEAETVQRRSRHRQRLTFVDPAGT
jgi:hypothetical protein